MIEFIQSETGIKLMFSLGLLGGLVAIITLLTYGKNIWVALKWLLQKITNTLVRFKNLPKNPFDDQGRITDPNRFFERQPLVNNLLEELNKGTNLSLIGEDQVGKSSLLYYISKKASNFIYLDMQVIHGEGDFFKALCDRLNISECRGYELDRTLRGQRYILCLDNIECMTNDLFSGDERTELRGLADGREAPLTLLIASRYPLAELFPDPPLRCSPLAGICQIIEIPHFSKQEIYTFIKTRLRSSGQSWTETEIETIWQETQGHPARVQVAAKALFQKKC